MDEEKYCSLTDGFVFCVQISVRVRKLILSISGVHPSNISLSLRDEADYPDQELNLVT